MTTKKYRRFSPEFKQQAVELARHSGDIMQTARDLGVDHSNLRKWIQAIEDNPETAFPGKGIPRDKELTDMKKRINDLEQENAILKKAVGIFAPRSR